MADIKFSHIFVEADCKLQDLEWKMADGVAIDLYAEDLDNDFKAQAQVN